MGAIANFGTTATEFPSSFPGITPHLLTLASNFHIPIYRDIIMAMGLCSVSKKSCERILRKGNGQAITIVVGGATESLSAHPGTADLTLRRRLGFIKIAIRNGWVLNDIVLSDESYAGTDFVIHNTNSASLVPVWVRRSEKGAVLGRRIWWILFLLIFQILVWRKWHLLSTCKWRRNKDSQ